MLKQGDLVRVLRTNSNPQLLGKVVAVLRVTEMGQLDLEGSNQLWSEASVENGYLEPVSIMVSDTRDYLSAITELASEMESGSAVEDSGLA